MEIPECWRKTSLGALVKHTKGFAFKSKNYKSSGVRIIRISDTSGLNIKVGNEIYCSEKEARSLASYQLEADDIIVNTVGSRPHLRESMVGRVIRITQDEAGSLLNQNMVRLKPNSGIDSDFLFYSVSNEHFLDFVSRIVRGNANQVSITLKDLFSFPAALPPLPEQRRIAKMLGTWDRAIAATEALIDQSEAQKKALMQQLLTGKRRLPGFEGEWKEVKLGDMFDILTAPSKTKKIDDTGTKLIVDMGAIDRSSRLVAHKKIVARAHPLNEGDLVMPKDDIGGGQIIGRVAHIPDSFTYELGDHVYGLRHKTDEVVPLFSYYRINEFEVLKSLRRKANGTAQLGLGKKDVLKQVVSFPPPSEQKAISLILKDADKKNRVLQAKLQTLKTEKAALMQQLLTGKRRVKLTEVA